MGCVPIMYLKTKPNTINLVSSRLRGLIKGIVHFSSCFAAHTFSSARWGVFQCKVIWCPQRGFSSPAEENRKQLRSSLTCLRISQTTVEPTEDETFYAIHFYTAGPDWMLADRARRHARSPLKGPHRSQENPVYQLIHFYAAAEMPQIEESRRADWISLLLPNKKKEGYRH